MTTELDGLIDRVRSGMGSGEPEAPVIQKRVHKRRWFRFTNKRQATLIYMAATLAAVARWTGSLLAAEGLGIPVGWEQAWHLGSLFLNVGMAVVEAFAFAYIMSALGVTTGFWRKCILVGLGMLAAATFVVVQFPYLMTQVAGEGLLVVLSIDYIIEHWVLALWCASIVMATISIVAGTAYGAMCRTRRRK